MRRPHDRQGIRNTRSPTMTIRTLPLLLLLGLLLAPGCGKQVVPSEVGPPGTQQPQKKEPKSYLRDEAQLKELIEQARENNLRVPSGTYATYGYILLQKKEYSEAVRNFELEMEIYPASRPQMDKLIQAAKRRQWLEQEIAKEKTGSAAPGPQQAQDAPTARNGSPETPRESMVLTETAPKASPAPSAAQPATGAAPQSSAPAPAKPPGAAPAKPSATGVQAASPVYSTLEEVLAFPADNGLVVALHLIGEVGEVKHFALREPLRYVMDVPGRWRVEGPKEIEVNSGKVKRIRIGEYPDKLRVVVDLSSYPDSVSDPVKSPDWLSITVR